MFPFQRLTIIFLSILAAWLLSYLLVAGIQFSLASLCEVVAQDIFLEKFQFSQGNSGLSEGIKSGSTLIGKIPVFSMLIFSPEHSPKNFSIFWTFFNSVTFGFANMAASSAYKEHRKFAALGKTGCRIPRWAACSMIRCNGSMAMMNNKGDNGSPCLRHLAWGIFWVGLPLLKRK